MKNFCRTGTKCGIYRRLVSFWMYFVNGKKTAPYGAKTNYRRAKRAGVKAMEWTDIKTTVPAVWAETAEAIATGISGGGIYIEDYRDLEAQVEAIAHVDLIEQELLDKAGMR